MQIARRADLFFLKLASGEVAHPTHHLHSLDSFVPHDPESICSPRSLDIICRRGLAPDDLRFFSLEYYCKTCGGDEERAQMWYDENEKRRQQLLKRMRAERRKLPAVDVVSRSSLHSSASRSSALPIAAEMTPFAESTDLLPTALDYDEHSSSSMPLAATQSSEGAAGAENGAGGVEGGAEMSMDISAQSIFPGVSKLIRVPHWGGVLESTMAALKDTADKERNLNEKLAKAEKRRTDTLLAQLLERKTLMEDCEKDVMKKHHERELKIAEKKKKTMLELHMRSAEHQRRHESMMQQHQREQQEGRKEVQLKLQNANDNLEIIAEKRRVQLAQQSELAHIKSLIANRRIEQRERVKMYHQHNQLQRIWQDDERLDLIASAQEVVQLERKELKIQISRERQIVDDLIDEFNREGTLHKSLQAHALKGPLPKQVRYLLKRGNVAVLKEGDFDADSFANKNKDASALARNTEVAGVVESGKYVYFRFVVHNPRASIKIVLKGKSGDPDLVVGNSTCAIPTKQTYTWKKSGFGDDKITINYFDENFQLGCFYIGVFGAGRLVSEFVLSASWKEASDKPA